MSKKVLVIRKQDKSVRVVEIGNKNALTAYNNKLPAGEKFVIEEMDESEAKNLEPIDRSYVAAGQALQKNRQLETKNQEQAEEIERLKKLLEKNNAGAGSAAGAGTGNPPAEKADDLIKKIKDAATEEEVNAILGTDERKSVLDAAQKRIAAINKQ